MDLLAELNPKQQEAVAAPKQHLLILAGAGSGKTRVLVHRIAWLIHHEHVSPHAVFAVTFTNKAATEMRSRIEALLNIPVQGLWVGTFHRLAHRILRIHWAEADLVEHFQILDSDDQLRLIKRVLKDSGLSDKEFEPKRLQWFINDCKDSAQRPRDIDDYGDRDTKTLIKLYENYEEACERAGVVDFAELLLRAYELLKKNEALRTQYQQRFQHLLVDEFQDTNTIQYAWLKLLAGEHSKIMAVGDDDQSIYGWRGAKVENILQFSKDYPDTITIRLEQNYRSTATILNAANQLIAQNSERLGKDLWTDGATGEPITVYAAFNDLEEARYIVSTIKHEGLTRRYQDIAVLYRSNAQSRVLEEALIHAGIPYRVYGGLRFFDRAEIKDALAYLRLINNRDDDAAMERVINNPPRGIGERSLQTLRLQARQENRSLWQTIIGAVEEKSFPPRANNALVNFLHLIDSLADECADIALYEQAEVVINRSGLWDYLEKSKNMQSQSRLENLQELITASKEFSSHYFSEEEDLTELSAFLAHAALESGEQQADSQSDCVQLMTLHSAKGLEFPLVFIAGLEEGLFPHMMSISDAARLEEERRLCYVGMTRAKQKLILTFAESRRIRGSDERHRPSRFIKEIPSTFLHYEKLASSQPLPQTVRRRSTAVDQQIPDSEFSIGQAVQHAVFGEGVILNYEGQGGSARVQVQFGSGELKWLMLAYANLSPLNSQPSS